MNGSLRVKLEAMKLIAMIPKISKANYLDVIIHATRTKKVFRINLFEVTKPYSLQRVTCFTKLRYNTYGETSKNLQSKCFSSKFMT